MKTKFAIFIMLYIFSNSLSQEFYKGPAKGTTHGFRIVNTSDVKGYTPNSIIRILGPHNILSGMEKDYSERIIKSYKNISNFQVDPSFYKNASNTNDIFELKKSFEGLYQEENIFPPDPNIAIGPHNIIEVVNSRFTIFDLNGDTIKSFGASNWLDVDGFIFDPKVIYDHYANRFVMVWLTYYDIFISVSDDSDALGEWYNWKSWTETITGGGVGGWLDYDGLGFDSKAIYITGNNIGDLVTGRVRIFSKNDLYNPIKDCINYIEIWDIMNPEMKTTRFLRPVRMNNYSDYFYLIARPPDSIGTYYTLYKIIDSLGDPILEAVNIPTSEYYRAPDNEQKAIYDVTVDGFKSDFTNEPIFSKNIIHLTHNVASGPDGEFSAIKYVSIDVTTNSIVSEITMGKDEYFYSFPALSLNKNNDLVITYTRSSKNEYLGSFYTTKLSNEDEFTGSKLLKEGNGYYQPYNKDRWGDYLGIQQDPINPYSIWFVGEYVKSENIWGTWIGKLEYSESVKYVNLLYPNGGQLIDTTIVNISWSYALVENINIEYSSDNGISWENIVTDLPASNNSFQWFIPNNLTSENMLVRIYETNDTSIDDFSDAPFTIFDVTDIESDLQNISEFSLSQNYPNPFNPSTKIKYQIPSNVKSETLNTKLIIYDILGREVATLVNKQQPPGTYELNFNASKLSSGVFYYQLRSGSFIETKKMILLK